MVRSVFEGVPSGMAALAITHDNLFLAVPHRNLSAGTKHAFLRSGGSGRGLSEDTFRYTFSCRRCAIEYTMTSYSKLHMMKTDVQRNL